MKGGWCWGRIGDGVDKVDYICSYIVESIISCAVRFGVLGEGGVLRGGILAEKHVREDSNCI